MNFKAHELAELTKLAVTPSKTIIVECPTSVTVHVAKTDLFALWKGFKVPVRQHALRDTLDMFNNSKVMFVERTHEKLYLRGLAHYTVFHFEQLEDRNGESKPTAQPAEPSAGE